MKLIFADDDGNEIESMDDIQDTLESLGKPAFGENVTGWVERLLGESDDEDDELLDINDDPYDEDLKYYQPTEFIGVMTDKHGQEWKSHQVWLDKRTCQDLFPGQKILEMSGDEIENPEFVDAQIGGSDTHDPIPDSFEVKVLKPEENPPGKTTCGHCHLSWDDDKPTQWTPAPSARCPFEYHHRHAGE